MKKNYLLWLLTGILMLSCSHAQAADTDPTAGYTSTQKIYYRWGEDVVLAVDYSYGWWNTSKSERRNSESFEGVMFPVYLGYLSFDDQGEEKMIYFTPGNVIDTHFIEALCENINSNRMIYSMPKDFSINDPSFCWEILIKLQSVGVYEVIRLPLGTAKDYDFAFKEQEVFRYEEADQRLEVFRRPYYEWGISRENLLMTPKE